MAVKKNGSTAPVGPSGGKGLTGADRRKFLEERLKSVGANKTSLKDYTKVLSGIPTDIPEIDSLLGDIGVIPDGTIVEFCGESMSGKSTVLYKIIASAIKRGYRGAILGPENSGYGPRMEALGIPVNDIDKFELYDSMGSAEQYIDLLRIMVQSGEYKVIGVDSITALVPESELEKSFEDTSTIGEHAKLINRMMKQLLNLCSETGTIVILINQFRNAKINATGAMGKRAGGGEGVAFFAHMRFWYKRLDKALVDANKDVIGNYSECKLIKTRYSQPDVSANFPIFYKEGKTDPLMEYLVAGTSNFNKYFKVTRGVYSYTHPNSKVALAKSDNPYTFRDMLLDIPPPPDKAKTDTSENAFEWVAKQLKYTSGQMNNVLEAEETNEIQTINDTNEISYAENPDSILPDNE